MLVRTLISIWMTQPECGSTQPPALLASLTIAVQPDTEPGGGIPGQVPVRSSALTDIVLIVGNPGGLRLPVMVPLDSTGTKPRSSPGSGSGGGTWRHTLKRAQHGAGRAKQAGGTTNSQVYIPLDRLLKTGGRLLLSTFASCANCAAHPVLFMLRITRPLHACPACTIWPYLCAWCMLAKCCGSVLSQCSCS
jgi:hypothetical protein